MEKRLQKIVDANFKLYPKREAQYIFPDGVCYFRKSQAIDYAKSSKQKYEEVKNKELRKEDLKGDKKPNVQMTKEKALDTLKGLELNEDSDYDMLGALVNILELEPDGKSKADRIKALEPVKAELIKGDNE